MIRGFKAQQQFTPADVQVYDDYLKEVRTKFIQGGYGQQEYCIQAVSDQLYSISARLTSKTGFAGIYDEAGGIQSLEQYKATQLSQAKLDKISDLMRYCVIVYTGLVSIGYLQKGQALLVHLGVLESEAGYLLTNGMIYLEGNADLMSKAQRQLAQAKANIGSQAVQLAKEESEERIRLAISREFNSDTTQYRADVSTKLFYKDLARFLVQNNLTSTQWGSHLVLRITEYTANQTQAQTQTQPASKEDRLARMRAKYQANLAAGKSISDSKIVSKQIVVTVENRSFTVEKDTMGIQYEPFGNHYFVGLKNRVDLLSDANGECQMRTYDFETGNVETQWLAPLAYWIHYWICQKKGMKEQDLSQEAAITADDLREYQTGNKQYNVQYPSKEYEDLYKLLHSFVNDAYQTIFSDSLYMTEDMIKQYPLLLGRLATSQSEEEFRDVLQEIFAMTPRKKPYNIWSIRKEDFDAIIEEEYDNFNVLHSTFKASEGKPSTQKQKVNPMHVNITTPTQREIQLVEKDMHANRNHLQYRKYTIYKVTSPAQDKAFKEYCARFKIDPDSTKETRYLWHGSRNANWESIITNHLMCKASSKLSGVTYTGSMFGDGIYLALEAQKSLGYASLPLSHWNSEHSNVGILGLYQCAYKNPIVCHRTHQYTEKFLKDKHSTCVHAYGKNLHPNEWTQLRNDEIIVFNPAAIALRYIVVFHS